MSLLSLMRGRSEKGRQTLDMPAGLEARRVPGYSQAKGEPSRGRGLDQEVLGRRLRKENSQGYSLPVVAAILRGSIPILQKHRTCSWAKAGKW